MNSKCYLSQKIWPKNKTRPVPGTSPLHNVIWSALRWLLWVVGRWIVGGVKQKKSRGLICIFQIYIYPFLQTLKVLHTVTGLAPFSTVTWRWLGFGRNSNDPSRGPPRLGRWLAGPGSPLAWGNEGNLSHWRWPGPSLAERFLRIRDLPAFFLGE